MSQEKEFDKAFKERLNQMDFEFKEAYWDEMEALLDNKRKKRGALFWWISGLSVASLIFAAALFLFPNNTTQKVQHQLYGEISTKNSDTSVENTQTPVNAARNLNAEENSAENSRDTELSKPVPDQNESRHQNGQKDRKQNTNQKQNKILHKSNTRILPIASPPMSSNLIVTEQKEQVINPVLHQKESLNNLNARFDVEINAAEQGLAVFSSEQPRVRTWDSHVGILVGSNYSQSVQTADGRVGGLGSHWGLRFYFAHQKGFQLNTGLSFGVNSINGLTYQETRKVFGFTQYDLVNTIHYKSMLTAHVPLYIGYEGVNISVAGGLRLNYIMNTRGKVYTWDNSIVDQNIWGYAHGIKYFNLACGIESTYRLARRWDLGLSYDFDLSSRSEENNDLISPEARLWQLGLFIKYRLN